ncbi:MAG TPA: bifunctional 4-hydroxy-2-oxoglutarate aldolase/2-dehydro-3-deoxy-phosphogluconate aldolase [Aggregatilineales bacterium]|nr:bifunctional 4-hydroxy-2-oxoglutarate aldolase/2-dehydro-3-deoxy-phosphogluconate aldolase [Aggregatilineales bacterium]
MEPLSHIEGARIVAIARGNFAGAIRPMVDALIAGGISVVEMTLNSPGALDALRLVAAEYGDRVLVGAGTVMQAAQVAQVAQAGGKFVISPASLPDMIRAALDHGLEPVPGTLTPTEIAAASAAGARLIKWFPALGPDYLRALRGPFDTLHFMPTGTIDESNIRAYFDAGAVAVGVGSALVPRTFDGSAAAVAELTARARRLMDRAHNRSVSYA